VAVISFYATKLLGAGEGGAVLTDDEGVAAQVRQWRDYANQEPDGTRLNDKMTDLEATLALGQLERLPEGLAERRRLARRYLAAGLRGVGLPEDVPGHAWYRFVVEADDAGQLMERLGSRGVQAVRPVAPWGREGMPPVTARAYDTVVSIPCYPGLTDAEQEQVIEAFR
jgi:perosamine synthetase